jgi:hypothetical protein
LIHLPQFYCVLYRLSRSRDPVASLQQPNQNEVRKAKRSSVTKMG